MSCSLLKKRPHQHFHSRNPGILAAPVTQAAHQTLPLNVALAADPVPSCLRMARLASFLPLDSMMQPTAGSCL